MADKLKITTGTNDRPKSETIAQTGEGLPDDSSQPVEATDDQIERAKRSLNDTSRKKLKGEAETKSSQNKSE